MLRLPAALLMLVSMVAGCETARPEPRVPAGVAGDAGAADGPAGPGGSPAAGEGGGAPLDARPVALQPWRWGPIGKDGCTEGGLRSISAPLLGVPAGVSAAMACQDAPRNVLGIDFPRPDRCEEMGGQVRGHWQVPDSTCAAGPPPAPVRGGEGALAFSTPLEGYADLHLHQMAHLGFGGSVVWGAAFGDPAEVLTPIPAAMKPGHDRCEAFFDGDIAGGLAGLASHGEDGHPGFASWPSRELATHQQAYEDWLYRSYQGGLRLTVMLAVNSEDMFGRGENDLGVLGAVRVQPVLAPGRSGNDMEALEHQVREAYRMQAHIDAKHGGPGRGWYRIVRDPEEAGEVIAGGRMAVILGTELQHLFNCDADRPACTEATIQQGLDRLEAMGVNYVFPVHHKLNQFGGAAQFNPLTTGPTADCWETQEKCAADGLSPLGRILVEELTARGMLIDTEHLSWKAFDDTLAIAEARRYPVLAGHIGPFDLEDGALADRAAPQDRPDPPHPRGGRHAGRDPGGGRRGVRAQPDGAPAAAHHLRRRQSLGQRLPLHARPRRRRPVARRGRPAHLRLGLERLRGMAFPALRLDAVPAARRPRRPAHPQARARGLSAGAASRAGARRRGPYREPAALRSVPALGLQHARAHARRPRPGLRRGPAPAGPDLADLEPLYRSARGVVELWKTARDQDVPGDRRQLRWVPRERLRSARGGHAAVDWPAGPSRRPPASPSAARGRGWGSSATAPASSSSPGRCRCLPGTLPAVAITSYHAGRCLDVDGASARDGARVQQWTCNGGDNQRWSLRGGAEGRWELVNAGSDRCLDAEVSATGLAGIAMGASRGQATCTGGPAQLWQVVRTGNTFSLRSAAGLCLEVSGQSRADGASLELAPCTGAANQQWQIESLRAADHERLYQADRNRIAWLAAPDATHPIPVTADGTRPICRSLDATPWVGVATEGECTGRTYEGTPATTSRFERLYQSR